MAQDEPTATEKPSAGQALGINLPGIGIFLLALAVGVLVRLFIPDAIMYGPKTPLSEAGGILSLVLVVPFVLWLALWFRSPASARLTAIGAGWSALLAGLTAFEIWRTGDWPLLPALAIVASFALMTTAQWLRMRRRAKRLTAMKGPY